MNIKKVKVTKEKYMEMLEVLPPRLLEDNGFLVGEPYDHNEKGTPRYDCYIQNSEDECYNMGFKTCGEFRQILKARKIIT